MSVDVALPVAGTLRLPRRPPLGPTLAAAGSIALAVVGTGSPLHRSPPAPAREPAVVSRATVAHAVAARPAYRVVDVATAAAGGVASWYGPGFHGRSAASGEIFDARAMTAAHRTLPFGTRLRVCTPSRCVVVRVNDRGPYVAGRVIDLSWAAARELGIERAGLADVTIAVLTTTRVPARVPSAAAAWVGAKPRDPDLRTGTSIVAAAAGAVVWRRRSAR